jgi:UDP-N-acetylglucosamine 4,6-dehydratase
MTLAPVPAPILAGRVVLITGGTGTFGQAFVRTALSAGARKVIVYSRGEAKQAAMAAELEDARMRYFIGDVRDAERLLDACRGVDVVIHAAALKRVEVCEADPLEAIATNITGTANVARACIERGVQQAVLLSTDKAAAPHTLYGQTKGVAERLWTNANTYAAGLPTRFAATRYGNVLGSTGSVLPLWKAQHARGETLAITDPAMTRFWMTIADAVRLVVDALTLMRGGEVFVPKVGAASVLTLVRAAAPFAATRVVGLRPGEKLHETLISADEARHTLDIGTHYVIEPEARTWGTVAALPGTPVAPDFTFRSDTAPALSVADLERMTA